MSVTLNQLLTLAGRLDDSPGFDTPREGFRRFLNQHVTDAHIARALIEQCQHALGEQHHRALQDLVVFVGRFLGFETAFGLYQPAAGAPEEYGRWLSRRRLEVVLEIRTDHKNTDFEDLTRTAAALTEAAEPARAARALGLCVLTPPYTSRDRFEEAAMAQKPHSGIRVVSLRSLLLLADMMGAGRLKHDDVLRVFSSIRAPDFVVELLDQFARAPVSGDTPLIARDEPRAPDVQEMSADTNFWCAIVGYDESGTPEQFVAAVIDKRHLFVIDDHKTAEHGLRPGDWVCFFIAGRGVVANARVASITEHSEALIRDAHRFSHLLHLNDVEVYLNAPVVPDAEIESRLPMARRHVADPVAPARIRLSWQEFVALTTHREERNGAPTLSGEDGESTPVAG
jgi:hypothetical protein